MNQKYKDGLIFSTKQKSLKLKNINRLNRIKSNDLFFSFGHKKNNMLSMGCLAVHILSLPVSFIKKKRALDKKYFQQKSRKLIKTLKSNIPNNSFYVTETTPLPIIILKYNKALLFSINNNYSYIYYLSKSSLIRKSRSYLNKDLLQSDFIKQIPKPFNQQTKDNKVVLAWLKNRYSKSTKVFLKNCLILITSYNLIYLKKKLIQKLHLSSYFLLNNKLKTSSCPPFSDSLLKKEAGGRRGLKNKGPAMWVSIGLGPKAGPLYFLNKKEKGLPFFFDNFTFPEGSPPLYLKNLKELGRASTNPYDKFFFKIQKGELVMVQSKFKIIENFISHGRPSTVKTNYSSNLRVCLYLAF